MQATILESLVPLIHWPKEHAELLACEERIATSFASVPPSENFRRYFDPRGLGQGHFFSYSIVRYWRAGRHHQMKGGKSYAPGAFLYASHVAPVACLVFGDGVWQRVYSKTHGPIPPLWKTGVPIEQPAEPSDGWQPLAELIRSFAVASSCRLLSTPFLNAKLPEGLASGIQFPDDWEVPELLLDKDLFFHDGYDLSY